jgi:uncharacterized membrane protein YgcG
MGGNWVLGDPEQGFQYVGPTIWPGIILVVVLVALWLFRKSMRSRGGGSWSDGDGDSGGGDVGGGGD